MITVLQLAVTKYVSKWLSNERTNFVASVPEVSSLRTQEPETGPYPEPTEKTPHVPSQSPQEPM
jgi:hypothetical protein